MYTGVHSDVSRESYSFELFDLPLDVSCILGKGNKPWIHGLCIPVDSFDLRCESVTYGLCIIDNDMATAFKALECS